jgi:serine/threonine-protein kinase
LVTSVRRPYANFRISPEGRRVAVVVQGVGDDELSVYDLTRETWTRLTSSGRITSPVWSPDGKRVAFSSNRNGAWNLFWTPADGKGEIEQLTRLQDWCFPSSFAPDGSVIAFDRNRSGARDLDIELLPLAGDRTPRPFLATPSDERAAAFSPTGRWIAYQSDETGRNEVYVRPYPGPGAKRTISTDGGLNPVWTSDRELLYLKGSRKVMAVDVRIAPDFRAQTPRLLFEAPFEPEDSLFDAVPGNQRIIAVQEPESATPPRQLVVIPDWLAEMERRRQAGGR